jgi:hypothetical protein
MKGGRGGGGERRGDRGIGQWAGLGPKTERLTGEGLEFLDLLREREARMEEVEARTVTQSELSRDAMQAGLVATDVWSE